MTIFQPQFSLSTHYLWPNNLNELNHSIQPLFLLFASGYNYLERPNDRVTLQVFDLCAHDIFVPNFPMPKKNFNTTLPTLSTNNDQNSFYHSMCRNMSSISSW